MKLTFVAPVSLAAISASVPDPEAPVAHASSWVMTLISHLGPRTDVDLSVLSVSSAIQRDQLVHLNGAEIHVLSIQVPVVRRGLWLGSPYGLFALPVTRLVSRIRRIGSDLVHGHGTEGPFGLAAIASRRPNVVSLQGIMAAIAPVEPTLSNRLAVQSERLLLRAATNVHAKSSFSRDHLKQVGFEGTVHYVEPAIDERFWSEPIPAARPRLVTVGSLITRKGVADLLHAMIELGRRGPIPDLDIVGSGRDQQLLVDLADELGLAPRVTFHGELAPPDVHKMLASGGIFVLASHIENSPNSIMEAMACGLPVVATDVGSIRDIVSSSSTGFVVPAKAPQDLAGALASLLADQAQSRSMGEQGRRVALARWHPDKIVGEMMAMYEAVLKDQR